MSTLELTTAIKRLAEYKAKIADAERRISEGLTYKTLSQTEYAILKRRLSGYRGAANTYQRIVNAHGKLPLALQDAAAPAATKVLASASESVGFTHTASDGINHPSIQDKKESIPVSKKNIANKATQKAVKAKMTPAQQAFIDGKDEAAPTVTTPAAADDLGLGDAPAKPKRAKKEKAADDLGLGAVPRVSPLADKKLVVTEAGKAAREGTVRAQVIKACAGGVKYPTALARLMDDESFKAPRSKKFADSREAYAKNRIARMVAIGFITAE